jgi:hypothetical protein
MLLWVAGGVVVGALIGVALILFGSLEDSVASW